MNNIPNAQDIRNQIRKKEQDKTIASLVENLKKHGFAKYYGEDEDLVEIFKSKGYKTKPNTITPTGSQTPVETRGIIIYV